jgi:hypothetical protein
MVKDRTAARALTQPGAIVISATTIARIRNRETDYTLLAELDAAGDLVLIGHDLNAWLTGRGEDLFGRADENEYLYRVAAAQLPRVCELLGVPTSKLLDGVRVLLAPHGLGASGAWKAWLMAFGVPYDFAVR